jgi:hypothetical protein
MAENAHRETKRSVGKMRGILTDYKYLNTKPNHMHPLEYPVMLAVRKTNGGYRQ